MVPEHRASGPGAVAPSEAGRPKYWAAGFFFARSGFESGTVRRFGIDSKDLAIQPIAENKLATRMES
jgi:hypothetical protein